MNITKLKKNAAERISQEKMKPDTQGQSDPFFYSKIDSITSGLRQEYSKGLYEISKENSLTIANYVLAMRTETNLSDHYRF